jgi:hypothetical protein
MANSYMSEFDASCDIDTIAGMRDCLVLFIHLIVTVLRLAIPRGARCVVTESVLVKHQFLILNRGRKRAPNLRPADRIIAGLCTFFIGHSRRLRSAIVLKPATLLHLQLFDSYTWRSHCRGLYQTAIAA